MQRWRAARLCEVEGCEKEVLGRGLCSAHYARWRRHGSTDVVWKRWHGFDRRCEVAGCELKHYAQGFCKRHYRKQFPERAGKPSAEQQRAKSQRRRALKRGATIGDPVLLTEIRERDGNRCGLCGKRVGNKPYPHPLSASLDHMIPLSKDGPHDPTNVQLAHLRCNVRKGNRGGGEQLMLCG